MSKIDDGGPAFPHPSGAQGCDGLTKRDWFAGLALQAGFGSALVASERAVWCYQMADAMLAARAKGGEA